MITFSPTTHVRDVVVHGAKTFCYESPNCTPCNTTKTFLLTKTELAKLRSIMAPFDLERLSNSLSDNGVTRAESSEVIFVILLEVALPTGRGFPDCLISRINHTLFITITRAALCAAIASALEGNSMKNSV